MGSGQGYVTPPILILAHRLAAIVISLDLQSATPIKISHQIKRTRMADGPSDVPRIDAKKEEAVDAIVIQQLKLDVVEESTRLKGNKIMGLNKPIESNRRSEEKISTYSTNQ
jgi:hypothetical protein